MFLRSLLNRLQTTISIVPYPAPRHHQGYPLLHQGLDISQVVHLWDVVRPRYGYHLPWKDCAFGARKPGTPASVLCALLTRAVMCPLLTTNADIASLLYPHLHIIYSHPNSCWPLVYQAYV